MKKQKHFQEILLISILSLTAILVWVYLSVFKILNKPSPNPVVTPQEIKIINPNFDEDVFKELEKKS